MHYFYGAIYDQSMINLVGKPGLFKATRGKISKTPISLFKNMKVEVS